jgi:hypothetical protein
MSAKVITVIDAFNASSAAPWETQFTFEKHESERGYQSAEVTIGSGNVSMSIDMTHKSLLALAEAATRMAAEITNKYDRVVWWTRNGVDTAPEPGENDSDASDD